MSGPVDDPWAVTRLDQLEALYEAPHPRFLAKVTDRLEATSRAFIAASPFCILATTGTQGPHATPRGDAPGFAVPLDDRTLALPDRRGNNRLDGLRDVLQDPRVALLFLIPGVGETLRVHGLARITADPALRARLAAQGKDPATVLLVQVREVYAHCAKSVMRSGIWGGTPRPPGVPSNGQMIAAHTAGGGIDAARYEAEYQARIRAQMY
ncbi:pyridoxamine 5'-phosphate oxidase family protein [Paracraurococcus ruber]|uniref:Flavin-nucleotide-binding protein n=1 Tax=Paracraurococcus ruber TaxID=77675 RepID=A0ABS1D4F3_9PROT|nr:pyridoxamine 5'-phosphate oxidase family protein [Paracraurococcus ruber]MBK1661649.1 flavin-nucleotide-binding protein [Paracraurococcus ruber]TDG18151.1 pyridoxamine 5'-phosphate oxidase family protein [Paracraurococcus ruber]